MVSTTHKRKNEDVVAPLHQEFPAKQTSCKKVWPNIAHTVNVKTVGQMVYEPRVRAFTFTQINPIYGVPVITILLPDNIPSPPNTVVL